MKQLIKLIIDWLWSFSKPQPQIQLPEPIPTTELEPIIEEPDIDDAPERTEQDGSSVKTIHVTTPVEMPDEWVIPAEEVEQNVRFVCAAGHYKNFPGKRSPVMENGKIFYEWESNFDFNNNIVEIGKKRGLRTYNLTPFNQIREATLKMRVGEFNSLVRASESVPTLGIEIHSNAATVDDPEEDWADKNVMGIETWCYHNSEVGMWAAQIFQKHLIKATGARNRGVKSQPYKQFYWLRKTVTPCVLLEINFFNNKSDVMRLMNPAYRKKVEAAIVLAMLEINELGLPAVYPVSYASSDKAVNYVGKRVRTINEETKEVIEGIVKEQNQTELTIIDDEGVPRVIDTINVILTIAPRIILLLQQLGDLFRSWFGGK